MYLNLTNHRIFSFLNIVLMLALICFHFWAIFSSPMLPLTLFLITLSVILFIKKPAWALAILIAIGTNFFGTLPVRFFLFIKLPGLGGLYIHDCLLLFFMCVMFLRFFRRYGILERFSMSYPVAALILLTGFQAIISFFEGNDPHFILSELRPFVFYFSYFMVLSSLNSKEELVQFLKLVVLIGIISAGVTYYQTITGGLIFGFKRYNTEYGLYQSLNNGMVAMVFTFLIVFSLSIGNKTNVKYILSNKLIMLWVGGALLLLLVRSIWISTLFGLFIVIILNRSRTMKSVLVLLLIAFGFIMGKPIIGYITGGRELSYIVKDRVITASEDVRNISGSFGIRTEGMIIRWNYMIHNSPFFGQGFKGTMLDKLLYGRDSASFDDHLVPTIITKHNIVADLAVRYGLSGFFVFSWILFTFFRKAIHLFRSLPDSWEKLLICGLLAFNVQNIIVSYSSSTFFEIWGIVILAPSWAVMVLIDKFHKQEQMKKLVVNGS